MISALVLFFFTLLFQLLIWKQFSLEATYTQLKNYFIREDVSNYLELGAICNSLRDFECSESYFEQVIQLDPNNKLGLANLGIVLIKKGEWLRGQPYLRGYFSSGGNSYDALYWYGISIWETQGADVGINWMLKALKENLNFQVAGIKAVEYFILTNQFSLALSLVGSMTRGQLEGSEFWSEYIHKEDFNSSFSKQVAKNDKFDWSLLSLDGVNFYIPVRLKENSRYKYFSVFEDVEYSLVATDVLNEMLIPVSKTEDSKMIQFNDSTFKTHRVNLKNVSIGGHLVTDFSLYACDKCPNILGKSFLKNFRVENWSENQVGFMKIVN